MQFMGYVGLFIGRSSLFCFTLKRIEIFTILLAINGCFLTWMTYTQFKMIVLEIGLMILVGVFRGMSHSQGMMLV